MKDTRLRGRWFVMIACWMLVWHSLCTAAEDGSIQYNTDVRPILAEYCFSCHGPDMRCAESRPAS